MLLWCALSLDYLHLVSTSLSSHMDNFSWGIMLTTSVSKGTSSLIFFACEGTYVRGIQSLLRYSQLSSLMTHSLLTACLQGILLYLFLPLPLHFLSIPLSLFLPPIIPLTPSLPPSLPSSPFTPSLPPPFPSLLPSYHLAIHPSIRSSVHSSIPPFLHPRCYCLWWSSVWFRECTSRSDKCWMQGIRVSVGTVSKPQSEGEGV